MSPPLSVASTSDVGSLSPPLHPVMPRAKRDIETAANSSRPCMFDVFLGFKLRSIGVCQELVYPSLGHLRIVGVAGESRPGARRMWNCRPSAGKTLSEDDKRRKAFEQ